MTDAAKRKLAASKIDSVIVPPCTKYIQAPDVVWNKPFKAKIQELCYQWLANTKHEFTAAGNMKAVPRRQVVELVIKMIAYSMKSCGISIDGSEDHLISCFKEGNKTDSGSKLLANQTKIISDTSLDENPFLISEDDITDAAPQENIIDEDDFDIDDIW